MMPAVQEGSGQKRSFMSDIQKLRTWLSSWRCLRNKELAGNDEGVADQQPVIVGCFFASSHFAAMPVLHSINEDDLSNSSREDRGA